MALPILFGLNAAMRVGSAARAFRAMQLFGNLQESVGSLGGMGSAITISAKVRGVEDLKRALSDIPKKLRKQLLRNALTAGARVVRDEIRLNTPVLSPSNKAVAKGWRKPGTLKKSIAVRTSRRDSKAGNVGVFVNVKPAKAGQRGAKNANDPFYWRWIYDGWNPAGGSKKRIAVSHRSLVRQQTRPKRVAGNKFLDAGGRVLTQALKAFTEKLGPAIQKLNNRT